MTGLDALPTCSEVTRVEVLRGVRSGGRAMTERLLRSLEWASVDEAVARRAGELGRRYRSSHAQLGVADLVLAATAQELGLELATGNVRRYPLFPDLRPPYSGGPTGQASACRRRSWLPVLSRQASACRRKHGCRPVRV